MGYKKSDIVKEYMEKYPNTPFLTLAKAIYKNNKECFTDIEDVRSIIRYYGGSIGKKNLYSLKDRRFVRDVDERLLNPFKLPESDEKEYDPYVIPKAQNKILLLSDVHVPYHSVGACTSAMQYGLDNNVNTVILNGDIIDFHQLSAFVKDPRKRHFSQEINTLREFMDVLQNTFSSAKFYYKAGNHCERLETYLKVKAPELLDMNEFRLDTILKFGERGVEYVTDKRKIKAGKLNILHGHELKGGIIPPVNPARGMFLRTGVSTIAGHFHRTSHHADTNLNEEFVGCWSTGCLSELHPEYMPNNKWNHGAAIITVNDDGSFHVDNFQIYNGKIL